MGLPNLAAQVTTSDSFFDTILGLPVHPLAVHIPVVVLPVAALGLVTLVLIRPLRRRFALLTLAGLVVGAGGAFLAKGSGARLAARVGEPETHAYWGGILPFVAAALLVLGGVWLLWARQAAGPKVARAPRAGRARGAAGAGAAGPGDEVTGDTVPLWAGDPGDYGAADPAASPQRGDAPALTALGIVASLTALAVIALTVVVGHLGAEAAWADRIAGTSTSGEIGSEDPSPSPSGTPSGTASTSPSPTPTASGTSGAAASPTPTQRTYTMADVADHDSAASCWTVIDGGVYDVTDWIRQHPGGRQRIENLCGIDGSSFFENQHGVAERPNDQLTELRIGDVGQVS